MLSTSEREYLMEAMENLLDEYDYDYNCDALEAILDEWVRQKAGFIEAFKKHPNYIEGKFMIAFDSNYEREIDVNKVGDFCSWILHTVAPKMQDSLPESIKGTWHYGLSYDAYCFFSYLSAVRCITENMVTQLNNAFPELKFHVGQKTSRVINKICQYLGYDKADGYNREYAKFADALSPMVIKRHTILSINPLDYLTMSFGNSWASCHTIDKENRRGMPNDYSGCYSSGTISYMLDPTSMVLYTVDASYDGDEYWSEPKINRQMFHYGKDKLVQGRLYPQDNDRCGDVYTPYRNIVQQIISTIFEFPNLWTLKKGTEAASRYVNSRGTHYRDYTFYNNCTLSTVKGSENTECIQIGASPICINCGDTHNIQANINCCGISRCADCGAVIYDEDDIYWVDGECYCRNCVEYCEYCEEWHREDCTYIEGYGYVCDSCRNEHFICCYDCNTWIHEDDAYYIQGEDEYVCRICRDNYYTMCNECGEYFSNDDITHHNGDALCPDCYDEATEEENEDEVC